MNLKKEYIKKVLKQKYNITISDNSIFDVIPQIIDYEQAKIYCKSPFNKTMTVSLSSNKNYYIVRINDGLTTMCFGYSDGRIFYPEVLLNDKIIYDKERKVVESKKTLKEMAEYNKLAYAQLDPKIRFVSSSTTTAILTAAEECFKTIQENDLSIDVALRELNKAYILIGRYRLTVHAETDKTQVGLLLQTLGIYYEINKTIDITSDDEIVNIVKIALGID